MKITSLTITEVFLIEPNVFHDERGFFFESFHQKKFEDAVGYPVRFVQDNHSKSSKGVLRGLHLQKPPMTQGKLVRVIQGEIFDVAVDVRKGSTTFGKWVGQMLSSKNKKQLWIPEGFAHGFVTCSNTAEVLYKTTNYYSPSHETSIRFDDDQISIDWPIQPSELELSEKDQKGKSLKEL